MNIGGLILSFACFEILIIKGLNSLIVKELEVPSHGELGSSITLKCSYLVHPESSLYSVKWYKDDREFCRYTPSSNPNTMVFPWPDIQVELENCKNSSVKLDQLSHESSGAYRCEVSTEGPKFQTVMTTRNLTVIAYPANDPEITGNQLTYSENDYILVNCTSAPSSPPAHLEWFVNGVKAEKWQIFSYPVTQTLDKLFVRSLALRVQASVDLFSRVTGTMQLKCTATVADLPPWHSVITPKLYRPFDPMRSDSYGSAKWLVSEKSLAYFATGMLMRNLLQL